VRLNHITIAVSELERSVSFYERLGLEVIVHAPPRYARLYVSASDSTLSLEVMPDVKAGSPTFHLYFECENVDQTHLNLSGLGVVFTQPPTDMSYMWREAKLLDPDGYDVRLFSAGENRINPPWRLPVGRSRQS
jgi:catechol 2,3-dioxygenase-like lactoylglutathione lyase family enzyme